MPGRAVELLGLAERKCRMEAWNDLMSSSFGRHAMGDAVMRTRAPEDLPSIGTAAGTLTSNSPSCQLAM